jgi:hypothetical protein
MKPGAGQMVRMGLIYDIRQGQTPAAMTLACHADRFQSDPGLDQNQAPENQ